MNDIKGFAANGMRVVDVWDKRGNEPFTMEMAAYLLRNQLLIMQMLDEMKEKTAGY
jgi:hypothetical protein